MRDPAGPDDAGHGRLAVPASEQKLDPAIANIPLIVITATGKRPVLIDADELVMKPLDLGRLFEAIERYC